MVLEFVTAVIDNAALVVKCDMVAGSAVVENFNALEEIVAVTMGLIAVGSGASVVSGAILITFVVVTNNEDIAGILEFPGVTAETNVIIPVDIPKDVKFDELSVAFKLELLANGKISVVKVRFMVL